MENFRDDPQWNGILISTARTWCGLLGNYLTSSYYDGEETAGWVLDRCLHALPQIVQEMSDGNSRWRRSRWCELSLKDWVQPAGAPKAWPHVEHPWTKKRTKDLLHAAVVGALQDSDVGPDDDGLIEAVAQILDVRCDTVILPGRSTAKLGIQDGRNGLKFDGFRQRYLPAMATHNLVLWDRLLCREVTEEELIKIDEEKEAAWGAALERIQNLGS